MPADDVAHNSAPDISIISLIKKPEELITDFHPTSFSEYCGQQELKKRLQLYTAAAQQRNEPLDHVLLFGPPGLGKTTLATIMARELKSTLRLCSGPTLERTGDLVSILSSLEPREILFIDEIHRMPTAVEEILYSAMEQFRVDVIVGQGAGARSMNLPLNPFTLIGATTKSGLISAPLRSRFGITERLDFYTATDLCQLVVQYAERIALRMTPDAALMIAHASRGTPRVAKKIVRRVRDFAQVHHDNVANEKIVHEALHFFGIGDDGLTSIDRTLIKELITRFNGGPAGVETLASLVGEESQTLEDVYEPYLMRLGYLERTPRGRQIPPLMLPHLSAKFVGQNGIF